MLLTRRNPVNNGKTHTDIVVVCESWSHRVYMYRAVFSWSSVLCRLMLDVPWAGETLRWWTQSRHVWRRYHGLPRPQRRWQDDHHVYADRCARLEASYGTLHSHRQWRQSSELILLFVCVPHMSSAIGATHIRFLAPVKLSVSYRIVSAPSGLQIPSSRRWQTVLEWIEIIRDRLQ